VVANFNAGARADLVLPLSGHDLSVGSRNLDSRVEAGLVVSISDNATKVGISTSGTIVGTLWPGVSVAWPPEGMSGELGMNTDESVFLFNAVPSFLFLDLRLVPHFVCVVSEVSVCRQQLLAGVVLPVPAFAEHEDVVAGAERITEVSDGLEDDLGLFRKSLVGRRAIVVPFGNVGKGVNWLRKSAAFRAEGDTGAIKPHVLSNDGAALIKAVEAVRILVV
jgi:hypothetical protein